MSRSVLLFGGINAERICLQSCLGEEHVLMTGTHFEANGLFAGQHPACASVCESSILTLRSLVLRREVPLFQWSNAPRPEAADGVRYTLGRWFPSVVVRSLIQSASRACSVPRLEVDLRSACNHTLPAEPLQRLAVQRDLCGAEEVCVSFVSALATVTRAEWLFFDSERGALWSEAGEGKGGTEHRFVGAPFVHAARAGTIVNVPAVAAGPRWVVTLDGGQNAEHLLAIPIMEQPNQGHAVLIAWRAARHSPFATEDEMRLAVFVERAAPLFDQPSLELKAVEAARGVRGPGLFRAEALESRLPRRYGAPLRIPREGTWPYVVLACLVGFAGALLLAGSADWNAVLNEAEARRTHPWFRPIYEYACELTGRVACRGQGTDGGLERRQ